MSVLDIVKRQLVSQAKRIIIGYPSGDNTKATGLQYSIEYYAKESVNPSRSDMHKLVAKIANQVLSSDELADCINQLVEKYAGIEVDGGYENSALKVEDDSQKANDAKVATTKAVSKAVRKPAAKKSTSKSKK